MEEQLYKTPIILQFNSELKEGRYYRLGKDVKLNNAVYRIYTDIEFSHLTKEEKIDLIKNKIYLSTIWKNLKRI